MSQNSQIEKVLNPFRSGKQAYWCAPICTINGFIKFFNENKPMIGGSWNPTDYIDKEDLDKFVKWISENYPECLSDINENDILLVSMGETFEDEKMQQHSVDINDVVDNWIGMFAGHAIAGMEPKCPPFGILSNKNRYKANYYYKKGGIVIKREINTE